MPSLEEREEQRKRGEEAEGRSFNRGMCATWGLSDEEDISSSDEEMSKGICFMAHGGAPKVKPLPIYVENMSIDEDMFDDMEEAYVFLLDLTVDMISKLKILKRVNEQLEDDKEQLAQDVSYEKRRCHELSIKL